MRLRLKLFLAAEFTVFIIIFIYLNLYYIKDIAYSELLFLIMILFLTNNLSLITNTGKGILTSITLPVMMPGMIILGPFWTGIMALVGTLNLRQIKNKFIWYQVVFNQTNLFIAAGLGSFMFNISYNSSYFSSPVFPFLLAAMTYFIINNSLVFLVVRIAKDKKQESSLISYFLELGKNLIFSYFMGLIFYYSYVNFGKIMLVLAIFLIYILKDFLYSRLQQLNHFTQIVESFLKVIDSKDHYTEGHCERVARYTYQLCQELGFSKGKLERIVNMAKIHDIGKIYIDDAILKSSVNLTHEEYREMKLHSAYGYKLLKDIDLLKSDLNIILYHHERYDGEGYPEGISGDQIPVGSKVLNICDAFDVMTTGRSYKPAKNKEEVIEEFKDCAGGQFDPEIAEVIIDLIREGRFDDSFKDTVKRENEEFEVYLNTVN